MSGIAGVFSPHKQNNVKQILEKIKHRGNSSKKIWQGQNAVLGAVCLSSINEKPGPVTTPSGERGIVMDGRLIDQRNLQSLLKFQNLNDYSDAEVTLHAYEELGSRVFGRLQGEFALAIADKDHFVLARDRLGIRPLYYGIQEGKFWFASEAKALINLVETVHEFPPGHFLLSHLGLYPYDPYLPMLSLFDGALDSAEQLNIHLGDAVQKSIPDGIDVGVWLSGGVDSSIIAALARMYVDRLYTFSAGIEGAPDLLYAQRVAQHLGAIHYERIYGVEEMQSVLEKVIYHLESFDAPLVHSAVGNFLVSELASDHVPFVLSGEGGDELFAGYTYQKTYGSEVELMLSVQEAIASLHNTALQRVDRSASAHSTGAAVPFLSPDVIRYALAIPARWKIRGKNGVEKWPLRQGLTDILPDEVIWREKSKFWEGSGSGETLTNYAESVISDDEYIKQRDLGNGDQLRSKEELIYYRIFKQHFGESIPIKELGRTQHI